MPRTPATEAQRNEESRRIRDAAGKLFAAEGIGAISARAVAKEAGVSVGKIYAYYTNLTELMQSLWQGRVQALADELEELARRTQDPVVRIRKILQTYVEFAQKNPELYKGALMYVRPEAHPKPEPQDAETLPIMALLIEAVSDGQKKGAVRAGSSVRMAQMLWAGVHGALALPVNIDRFAFGEKDHLPGDMLDALMEYLQVDA